MTTKNPGDPSVRFCFQKTLILQKLKCRLHQSREWGFGGKSTLPSPVGAMLQTPPLVFLALKSPLRVLIEWEAGYNSERGLMGACWLWHNNKKAKAREELSLDWQET